MNYNFGMLLLYCALDKSICQINVI
uniref:Uncharacterized protein n=1 Tax=Anguilla anguilla TaxID=7936 RepID=A0A0E9TT91_ANGAN